MERKDNDGFTPQPGEPGSEDEFAPGADAGGGNEHDESSVVTDERIADLERRLAEQHEKYLRLVAEYDNYRKRTARDHQALVATATERLVKEILPVLDDLERALDAAAEHEEAKLEEGVRLVHRELSQVLQKEGLIAVDAEGKFDPHEHEALLTQSSEAEEGAILEVIQKGYRLGDRVLRPARVVVSAGGDAND